MPKLKTRCSIKKRFKLTSNFKLIKRNAGRSHLLQKKSSKIKRKLRKVSIVSFYDVKNFINGLPYIKSK
uniref:Large ribosomal subunit protein bL35c n=1 Tax=Polysiphonia scopulorum TaxID=257860 RepID=A0A1Z1MHR5_9FLOR|nr:ribosomal protein L35 [Polysiphonia scopulorum]ARW65608.1 ribosomal protein L35 [Polysiphonia scopulorum]